METMKTALVVTGGYCNVEEAKRALPKSVDLTIAADSHPTACVPTWISPPTAKGSAADLG